FAAPDQLVGGGRAGGGGRIVRGEGGSRVHRLGGSPIGTPTRANPPRGGDAKPRASGARKPSCRREARTGTRRTSPPPSARDSSAWAWRPGPAHRSEVVSATSWGSNRTPPMARTPRLPLRT